MSRKWESEDKIVSKTTNNTKGWVGIGWDWAKLVFIIWRLRMPRCQLICRWQASLEPPLPEDKSATVPSVSQSTVLSVSQSLATVKYQDQLPQAPISAICSCCDKGADVNRLLLKFATKHNGVWSFDDKCDTPGAFSADLNMNPHSRESELKI